MKINDLVFLSNKDKNLPGYIGDFGIIKSIYIDNQSIPVSFIDVIYPKSMKMVLSMQSAQVDLPSPYKSIPYIFEFEIKK